MRSILARLGATVTACACAALSAASAAPITSVTVDGELTPADVNVANRFAEVGVVYYDIGSDFDVAPDGTVSYSVRENIDIDLFFLSASSFPETPIFDLTRTDFATCQQGPDCTVDNPFRPLRDMVEGHGYAFRADDPATTVRERGGTDARLIEGFLTGDVDGPLVGTLVSNIGGFVVFSLVTEDGRRGAVRIEFGDYSADAVPVPAAALLFLTGAGGLIARRRFAA